MFPSHRFFRIAIVAGPALSEIIGAHFSGRADWRCLLSSSLDSLNGPGGHGPDLVILDADLCADASPEALASLRGMTCPLILIGGDEATAPAQAVAHLPRPFRLAELVECVRKALSYPPQAASSQTPPGLRLTEKEAAIFVRLVSAGGELVTRTRLLSEVWGYGPGVSTRTLETHLGRLRRKLAVVDPHRRVVSAQGGYRLVDSASAGAEKSRDGGRKPLG